MSPSPNDLPEAPSGPDAGAGRPADAAGDLDDVKTLSHPGTPAGPPSPPLETTEFWPDTVGPGGPAAAQHVPSWSDSDFGKYELLGELGRGGMGVVYKARQKGLDRLVALKMILASHLASAEQVDRFYAEARAAARLHDPNIVRIHDVGEIHGQHYFAMEYIDGPNLAELAAKGAIDLEAAARHVETVARAVGRLHAQGIVHRDLKPPNILLDRSGRPFVTDFGLVKLLGDDSHVTCSGAILGTPNYMAPEQATGRARDVGPACDVYALGAILYELLTGRPPFVAESPMDTLMQVLEAEPVHPRRINPRVPRALELICLKCLEKNPKARYASAEALADDLRRFLDGEDVEALRAGHWQRLRRWARQEPALASRLGGLVLCATLAQLSFHVFGSVTPGVHARIMATLLVWGGASVVFQGMLQRGFRADTVRLAWAGADLALLTVALIIDDAMISPLVVIYAVLVAASGLWFRVPLVWATTAMAEVAYAILLLEAVARNEELPHPTRHITFMIMLGVLGFIVAYQVKRVRVLSNYYEHRPAS
jgi:eukaryotic-like serine/threonine-protein kinase